MGHTYRVECRRPDGSLRWAEDVKNLTPTSGLNAFIDIYYNTGGYTASPNIGFIDASPTFAASDTMVSHPGWAEMVSYADANRPGWTPGAVVAQSVDNSASPSSRTMNASDTIGGVFMVFFESEKGSSNGALMSEAAFSIDRPVGSGDVVSVVATVSIAST